MSEDNNNNGYGPDESEDDDDNVVRIPTLSERDRLRKVQEKARRRDYKKRHKNEPMINLPPVTKALVVSFLVLHALFSLALDPPQIYWLFSHFGFMPGVYTGEAPFSVFAIIAPFTYMFIHGNWVHVIMNSVMTMAFGTGVERWMGGRRMMVLFVLCSLSAALVHFLVSPSSLNPVVGASGGLSGLFAAIIMMMRQHAPTGAMGKQGLLIFVGLWIVISIVFGLMGGPGGESVAWVAHIGGFLAGFLWLKPVMRMKEP